MAGKVCYTVTAFSKEKTHNILIEKELSKRNGIGEVLIASLSTFDVSIRKEENGFIALTILSMLFSLWRLFLVTTK